MQYALAPSGPEERRTKKTKKPKGGWCSRYICPKGPRRGNACTNNVLALPTRSFQPGGYILRAPKGAQRAKGLSLKAAWRVTESIGLYCPKAGPEGPLAIYAQSFQTIYAQRGPKGVVALWAKRSEPLRRPPKGDARDNICPEG